TYCRVRGRLSEVATRVLQRASADTWLLHGGGPHASRGAGARAEGAVHGVPAHRAASTEPVRAGSAHRWARRGWLDPLPDRKGWVHALTGTVDRVALVRLELGGRIYASRGVQHSEGSRLAVAHRQLCRRHYR